MVNYRALSENLQTKVDCLQKIIEGKNELISSLVDENNSLNMALKKITEEMGTLKRMHFGTSSEKTHSKNKQEEDMGEEEKNKDTIIQDNAGAEEDIQPKKKRIYKRPERRNYDDVPVEKVIELRPDDLEIKGATYVKTVSSFRFYWIPGRLCKIRIDRKYYAKDGHLIYPEMPYVPDTFEKRHADPTFSAAILTNKYFYHIPYERQLNMMNNGKIKIAKTTLFDYANAGIDALEGLYEAIKEKVLQDNILHIDETTQNMINTEEHKVKKGYDWGFISQKNNLMFFVRSNGSRRESVLDEQLKNFSGHIHTDGYGAYTKVAERTGNDIIQVPCMSHIRRKLWDAIPYHKKLAEEGIQIVNRMFTLERLIKKRGMTAREILAHRKRYLKFLLDKFKSWLSSKVNAEGFVKDDNIGKAIQYAWSRVDLFYELLKNSKLELSNNLAERTMRSHAMGRNSYLFCWNETSAERTCKIYSIIESCKLCKIDPYRYLCEVLTRVPKFGETWDDLLPCNIKL